MNTKNAKKKDNQASYENIEVTSFEVRNVRVIDTARGDLVFFSLCLNGVWINNCKVATGKNGDFVGWPQYKGSDNKWYNNVYASLSDTDTKNIMDAVQREIDGE